MRDITFFLRFNYSDKKILKSGKFFFVFCIIIKKIVEAENWFCIEKPGLLSLNLNLNVGRPRVGLYITFKSTSQLDPCCKEL